MRIFMVASTSPSWMNTGYGHSLLAAGASELLVSFEEFSKKPGQQLAVRTMSFPYDPNKVKEEPREDLPGRAGRQPLEE
jgi:hypothetical protein